MEANLFTLYDESGFSDQDVRLFQSIGKGLEERAANILLYLSLERGGVGDVRKLLFTTEPNRAAFFNKIMQEISVICFSTMPRGLLEQFDGEFFIYLNLRIRAEVSCEKEGQRTTPYRWIKFVMENEQAASITTTALTEVLEPHTVKASPDKFFKTYYNCINFDADERGLLACYNHLFQNRNRLPLSLPPAIPAVEGSYFGTLKVGNRPDVPIIEIRRHMRERILSYPGCNSNCLFVKLWEML